MWAAACFSREGSRCRGGCIIDGEPIGRVYGAEGQRNQSSQRYIGFMKLKGLNLGCGVSRIQRDTNTHLFSRPSHRHGPLALSFLLLLLLEEKTLRTDKSK